MKTRITLMISIVVLATVSVGCFARQKHISTNAFEYLYPEGSNGTPGSSVALELPLRVGIAFAPGSPGSPGFHGYPGSSYGSTLTEAKTRKLMATIADTFRDREMVERIEIVPGHYLTRGGGFDEMNRIKTALGLDLVVLVSFDQHQFSDPGLGSFTYLTVVGAYVVKGTKQDTVTLMDAAVFDIESKALLFRASGENRFRKQTAGMYEEKAWRKASNQGFDDAAVNLAANLDEALTEFTQQAASGTVRGRGTPKLERHRFTRVPGQPGRRRIRLGGDRRVAGPDVSRPGPEVLASAF